MFNANSQYVSSQRQQPANQPSTHLQHVLQEVQA
jgi:hypothetical protein